MLIVTCSPRVPSGILAAPAWDALRSGPCYAVGVDVAGVRAAGIGVTCTAVSDLPDEAVALVSVDDAETLAALGNATIIRGSWDLPGARLLDAVAVMDRLRGPGGCPWDAEQTHESLRQYLVEETYEAVDAITGGDVDGLREELGDVLLQVLFHSRIAADNEDYTIDDVAVGIAAKLIRRHPHVFAEVPVRDSAEVHRNWEEIKKAEKQRGSSLDGVPRSLPALKLAETLQRKADRAGFGEVASAVDGSIGAELFALVARARAAGIDPEQALRDVATAYDVAVRAAETKAPDAAS
ncbi:MAG: nucleoside triphosphate pyrophosphohydrolase [Mycobacteriales bacterium]